MAAAAITANYEIAHNLKSIQLRDPIFFPRPMFSRVRNAMKLSFAFYDLSNYLKIQNGRRNWRFQTYSRGVILFLLSFLAPTATESSMNFCGSYKLTCQLFTSFQLPTGSSTICFVTEGCTDIQFKEKATIKGIDKYVKLFVIWLSIDRLLSNCKLSMKKSTKKYFN